MLIVEEEIDESVYWMELLAESKFINQVQLEQLASEANELLKIIVASVKTARKNISKSKRKTNSTNI